MDLRNSQGLRPPIYLKWLYHRIWPSRRASYLADWLDNPNFPLPARIENPVPRNSSLPGLLFLPMTDWHARIQRSQHLAMTFGALGTRCFYLNPHLGREFPQPYLPGAGVRMGAVAPQVLELHVHLPREPVYHHRLLTPGETALLVGAVAKLLKADGGNKLVQFVSFPLWLDLAVRLKEEFGFPIVYDCHDLLSGFRSIAGEIVALEPALMESADLVCFTSQWLLDETAREHPSIRQKSMLVRNAVNPADYPAAAVSKRGGRPTIGYVGSLDFWFDAEAIRQAALLHPEWNFSLIGRVESAPALGLQSLPNVTLEGEIAYRDLPQRMSGFDVAVIPFLKMPLTLATNPLKLYEYLCLGIPVVSTRLPEVSRFKMWCTCRKAAAILRATWNWPWRR